ncbi:MAG TPA: Arc family DNA-binding protein [Acetobacteraceae bacterium]|jgi:plasmid stability protein|nr:Arc family DNA-binding protein [Acetobacteraceae bacterium]
MASIIVRNLPDEVHRALRVRAAQNGRSAEAEIRNILERAVKPTKRVRLGDALAALGRKIRLTDEDIAAIDQTRDTSAAKPMTFE